MPKGRKSVNYRHANAGHICSVFPQADRVALYFERGGMLDQGDGLKKGRYLRPGDDIPLDPIGILLAEAIALFA